MVRRSFGASSFAGFWRYWNPLFGYYLYYWCYKPLVRFVPRAVTVVLTFAVSGAIHDLFASLAVGYGFVLFAPVFAVFGCLVVAAEQLQVSFARVPVGLRAALHAVVLTGTCGVGLWVRSAWL